MRGLKFCVLLLVCSVCCSSVFADAISDYNDWVMPSYFEKPMSMQVDYQGGAISWMNCAASMLAAKGYESNDPAAVYSILDANQGSFASLDKYSALDWYLNVYQASADHAVTQLTFDSSGGITRIGGGGFINQFNFNMNVWWRHVAFCLQDCSQFSFDIFGASGTLTQNWMLWAWAKTTYWEDAGYHFDTDPSETAACRIIDGFMKGPTGITDIETLDLVDNGHGGLCIEHQTPGLWTDYNIVDYSTESFWFWFGGQQVQNFNVVIVSPLEYDGNMCPEPGTLWGLAMLGLAFVGMMVRRFRK